ncbi:MAG: Uma2 family endonuclease [Anaerolineae bacterium]|nr:Uma2 family endonuclease [Anaerolineae bacterium]
MLNMQPVNKEQFYEFVMRPENRDRNFEYIAGEIVEVVSNGKSSREGNRLVARVTVYVEDNDLGRCTGADGGYVIAGEDYIPDGAFISYARQPEENNEAYNPLAPDLAIEMLSPGNTKDEMTHKIGNYMAAGTVVWVGNPETQIIDVHIPGQPVKRLRVGDVLEGGDVLPGFKMAVAAIFKD